MSICYCSIASPNYLANALTSLKSMVRYQDAPLTILISERVDLSKHRKHFPEITFLTPNDIPNSDIIQAKYKRDELRWALKPLLLNSLLYQHDKVIYVDNDIYFKGPFDDLLAALDHKGIAITPHWRSIQPEENNQLIYNLTHGYFNAGMVGASRLGLPAIRWWRKACEWKCEKNECRGLYVDQKYLDMIALEFSDTCEIIKNKGYNVASWNLHENERKKVDDQWIIDGQWPLVCAHLGNILPPDHLQQEVYEEYSEDVGRWNEELTNEELLLSGPLKNWGVYLGDDGPLGGKLWEKEDAEKMLRLFRKGLIHGFSPANYEIKSVRELLASKNE